MVKAERCRLMASMAAAATCQGSHDNACCNRKGRMLLLPSGLPDTGMGTEGRGERGARGALCSTWAACCPCATGESRWDSDTWLEGGPQLRMYAYIR